MKKLLQFLTLIIPFFSLSAYAQDASLTAGQDALAKHNYKNAQTSFVKYINSFKGQLSAYYINQVGYDTSNLYMRSTRFAGFKINHNWASGYYGLGIASLNLSQKDDALLDFATAVKIDPTYAYAYYQEGMLKKEKGDKIGSCQDIGEAIHYNDTMKVAEDAYSTNFCWMCGIDDYKKGLANMELKEYANAVKNFNMAAAICPDSVNYSCQLAIAYDDLGKTDSALLILNKVIEHDSHCYLAYYTRGTIHEQHQKYVDAFNDLSKAITIDPNGLQAYIHRANVCENMGNESSAIYDYQQTIRIDPSYGEGYYKIGVYRLKMDQEACDYFKKAAALGVEDAQGYVDDCNEAIKKETQVQKQ